MKHKDIDGLIEQGHIGTAILKTVEELYKLDSNIDMKEGGSLLVRRRATSRLKQTPGRLYRFFRGFQNEKSRFNHLRGQIENLGYIVGALKIQFEIP